MSNLRQSSVISPVRDALSPHVWEGEEAFRPDAKEFILDQLDHALSGYEGYLEHVKRVYIIGSITGLQYDDDADVDCNIYIDVEAFAMEMGVDAEALRHSIREALIKNNGTNLPDSDHPVNYFLATDDTMPPALGIYDLLEDYWIKRPENDYPEDFDPYNALKDAMERAETVMERIDRRWGSAVRSEKALQQYGTPEHKRRMLRDLKALKTIYTNLKEERQELFTVAKKNDLDNREVQLGTANVVYKAVEFQGYMDKLISAAQYLSQMEGEGALTLTDLYTG